MIKPLDVARQLASWGFVVLPAKFREKAPSVAWKDYQDRVPTEDEVAQWFSVAICNFWVLCGKQSKLVVFDADGKAALEWAMEHIGSDVLDRTPCVKTAKGWHFYFRLTDDEEVAQWSYHHDGVDFDVRSDGGGVIAPPSIHTSGVGYTWVRSPDECQLQPVPNALRSPLRAAGGVANGHGAGAGERSTLAALLAAPAAKGGRNEWLAKVAGHYAKAIVHQDAYEQSVRVAAHMLQPRLKESEVVKTIASIWRTEHAGNGGSPNADLPAHYTESDVAHLFATQNVETLWYVPNRGWFVYDESTGRYCADEDAALELVQRCVERMHKAATGLGGNAGKAAVKFVTTCASARGLKAILSLAQIEPTLRLPMDAFDAKPTLLNVHNGVLDLETGELYPHDPKYRMTRLAGCAYEGSGNEEDAWKGCPRWLKHLDYVLGGDKEELLFLWRWFGRALSGVSPSDNCRILMPIGTGRNGKTITVETVAAVLGEYAVSTNFTTWCVHYGGGDNPRADLVKLGGVRLVVTAESGEGHTLDENLIKQYTGGERVSPRALYARSETVYRPQWSMLMSTNHEPRMNDHSDGFWRRFLKIVFGVSIPEPDQDEFFFDKLQTELPGILAWMAAGYREWRKRGLDPPMSVLMATAESRRANDVVGQFIEENLEVTEGTETEMCVVYARYKYWCGESGIRRPLTAQQLSTRLVEHGLERGQNGRTRRAVLRNVVVRPSQQGSVASWLA